MPNWSRPLLQPQLRKMARGKGKRQPAAGPSKEKTKSVGKKETKTMQEILEAKMKEMTKSQFGELEAMPENVLVKIFNYLPNQDIRCGVALVCQKFYKICQDESLVPVKDLCIYGHPVMSHSYPTSQIHDLDEKI